VGQQILLRFTLRSDGSVTGDGFYFDDLSVKTINSSSASVSSNEINQFTIYPNPAGDVLRIMTSNSVNNYKVEILNTTGQVISTHNIDNTNPTIAIQDMASGIYFVKMNVEGTSKVSKFIKK
jgi:hypothetical protein